MQFERKINYYETDGMGIVHHSNYIRYLEEARIYYLDHIGLPYHEIEKQGVMIPVIGVAVEYKCPAKFNDSISIDVSIKEFNGVRMTIQYTITNKSSENLIAICSTKHCFTDSSLKPISLKKQHMDMFHLFLEDLSKNQNNSF